jgi:hypothetical protein
MEGGGESGAGAAWKLWQVDAVIRGHGMQPTAEVRSLLAAAAEQRMREHGEPLSLAVQRAMALLAVSARLR